MAFVSDTHGNYPNQTRFTLTESNVSFQTLTGNVGLSSEDGVLELIGHHCEFIVRCPVDSDGVIGSCAQLLPDTWSIGS